MSHLSNFRWLIAVALFAFVGAILSVRVMASQDGPNLGQRQAEVEKRRSDLAVAVYQYSPAARFLKITDLSTDAAGLLRGLPGVATVDVKPAVGKLTARVIHLADWQFVARATFMAELKRTDTDWQSFLCDVELVQLEQGAILDTLIRHHGLKQVLFGGLTEAGLTAFNEKLTQMGEDEFAHARWSIDLVEVRELLKTQAAGTARHVELKTAEKGLVERIEAHRQALLEMGTPFRMLLAGRLEKVLPLDDKELLNAINAARFNSSIKLDSATFAKWQDAMVKRALASGPVSIIVCHGSLDLTAAIRRVAEDVCEYVSVNCAANRKIAREQ